MVWDGLSLGVYGAFAHVSTSWPRNYVESAQAPSSICSSDPLWNCCDWHSEISLDSADGAGAGRFRQAAGREPYIGWVLIHVPESNNQLL